jgi:uncharacterized membrane protein YoaK (UPF0700 family)
MLLAVAAGSVDAVSFLGLGQVLTAAMTGHTILLGLALGQGQVQAALRSAVALAGFVAGAIVGATIVDRGPKGVVWSPAVAAALALELVILLVLGVDWHLGGGTADRWTDDRFPLIAAAGLAMGIQSATAQRIGVPGVATTYIAGTLTSLAARLVGCLRASRAASRNGQAKEVQAPWLLTGVCLAYGSGATFAGAARLWWPSVTPAPTVVGAVGEVRWPTIPLLLAIAIIAGVTLIAAVGCRDRGPPERTPRKEPPSHRTAAPGT